MASLAKNGPEVGTASWAEAQGAESMAKAPSPSFESATAGEKGGDTEVEKIRAVEATPAEALHDTAEMSAGTEPCL